MKFLTPVEIFERGVTGRDDRLVYRSTTDDSFEPVSGHKYYARPLVRYLDGKMLAALVAELKKQPLWGLSLRYCTKIQPADFATVRGLTGLTALGLAGTKFADDQLPALRDLKALAHLDLNNTAITDKATQSLKGWGSLRWLDLGRTAVSDLGIKVIESLKLERLSLGETKVTDTSLEILGQQTSLRSLRVSGTDITDAGLYYLKPLTDLRKLDLSTTQVSDAGLSLLEGMRSLRFFSAHKVALSDASLPVIANWPRLRYLDLSNTSISNKTNFVFPKASLLEAIDLGGCPLADPDRLVMGMPAALQSLDVRETDTSDAVLTFLAKLPRLAKLTLSKTKVGNAALEKLGESSTLRVLSLNGCTVSDDARVQGFAALTRLSLVGTNTADKVAKAIATLPNLESLSLQHTQLTPVGLGALRDAVKLHTLDIRGCRRLTTGLGASLAALGGLTSLSVDGHFADEDLQLLAKKSFVWLSLGSSLISSKSTSLLAGQAQLGHLDLAHLAFDDASVAILSRLQRLQVLVLTDTKVTQAGLSKIPGLANIREVVESQRRPRVELLQVAGL